VSIDVIDALRKTELFRDLDEPLLRALAERAIERRLARSEILFMIGDSATGLYVVVSGAVRAYRTGNDGREQIIHTQGPVATAILNLKKTNLDLIKQLVQEGQRKKQFKKEIDISLMMTTLFGTVNHLYTTKHYYKELNNLQSLSDEQFEKQLRKKLGVYLKSLFKAILTYED